MVVSEEMVGGCTVRLTFGQARLATSGLTENRRARATEDNGLCMREHGRNCKTA